MTESFGHKLNPYRRLRNSKCVKGIRQQVVITNNLSTIDENQLLTARFPSLGKDDVIVSGSTRLAFNITLESTEDNNRTMVNNIGRAIIKIISIKIEGKEVLCFRRRGCVQLLQRFVVDKTLTRKSGISMNRLV